MAICEQNNSIQFWTETRSWGAGVAITGGVTLAASTSVAFPTTAAICTAVSLAVIFGTLAFQLREHSKGYKSLLFHCCLTLCSASGASAVALVSSLMLSNTALQTIGLALTVSGLFALTFNKKITKSDL